MKAFVDKLRFLKSGALSCKACLATLPTLYLYSVSHYLQNTALQETCGYKLKGDQNKGEREVKGSVPWRLR
jgi:hypothetical protein